MDRYPSALAGVVGRLNEARLRLVGQGALRAACWSATAAIVLFAVLELVGRLRPTWWQDVFGTHEPPSLVLVATLTAAVMLAGGIVAAVLSAPPIEVLARMADQTFGLRERISTALEIERRSAGKRPAVVAAMISDAVGRSGAIDPAVLAAFRFPRTALFVPLAAVAAAAVFFLVPVQPMAAGDPIEARLSAPLGDDERAAVVDDIRRVAEVIDQEAVAHADAYMQAVANTLSELGEQIALAPETTRGTILRELGDLREHAVVAGGTWRVASGASIPKLVEALEQSVALPSMTRVAGPAGQEAPPDELDSLGQTTTGKPPVPTLAVESMLAELERRNDAARAAASGQAGTEAEVLDAVKSAQTQAAPGVPDANQNSNAQVSGIQADGIAQNKLPNATDEWIGDELVGQPGAAIGSGTVAELLDLETVSEMVVTGEDTGVGDSVEAEITPDTKLTEITEQSLSADTEAWRRNTESEAGRYAIGIDDRDTVSRYMLALVGAANK